MFKLKLGGFMQTLMEKKFIRSMHSTISKFVIQYSSDCLQLYNQKMFFQARTTKSKFRKAFKSNTQFKNNFKIKKNLFSKAKLFYI